MKNSHLILAAACAFFAGTAGFAQQEAPPDWSDAEVGEMIDAARAHVMRPGEVIEGWNSGGANPEEELRRRGADKYYLLGIEGAEQDVLIVTDRSISDVAPSAWKPLDTYGDAAERPENGSVSFVPMDGGYVVALRSGSRWHGGILCSSPATEAVLYADPASPFASHDHETAIALFRIAMLALEGETVCVRYDGDADRGWRARFLLPDGRALPELNKEETVTRIVPAGPLERLVRGGPID